MPEPQSVQELYQFTREALNAIVEKVSQKFRVIETRLADLETKISALSSTTSAPTLETRSTISRRTKSAAPTGSSSFSAPSAPTSSPASAASQAVATNTIQGATAPKTKQERDDLMKALRVIESL